MTPSERAQAHRDRLEELEAELDRNEAQVAELQARLGVTDAEIERAHPTPEVERLLDRLLDESEPAAPASSPSPFPFPHAVRV